jgi:integrase
MMSAKNSARLRALLEPDTYAAMLHLPEVLKKRAEALWKAAREKYGPATPPPLAAARLMMNAVVAEILLFCPLRRKNLITLRPGTDLIRTGPTNRITGLIILGGATKNGEPYEWEVADSVATMIEIWIRIWRPVLAAPGNPYLFPGVDANHRNLCEFATQFSDLVEREVGAEYNMHLARHFAVVRYLRRHPGQYSVVSRLLGHKKVQTTINFYAGLETNAVATVVNKSVLEERASTALAAQVRAKGSLRKPNRKPKGGR